MTNHNQIYLEIMKYQNKNLTNKFSKIDKN